MRPYKKMYDHTRRILTRALKFIENYKTNQIGPNEIMGLVGVSLGALEEELPNEIYKSWNTCECKLELLIVMQPELNQNEEVLECINHFEILVRNFLAENESEKSDWASSSTADDLQVQAKPSLTHEPLAGATGKSPAKPAGHSTPNKNSTSPKKWFGFRSRNIPLMYAQMYPALIGLLIIAVFNILDDSYQNSASNPYIMDLIMGISFIIMSLTFLIMVIEKEDAVRGRNGPNVVIFGFFVFAVLIYLGRTMIVEFFKGIALLK